jgi:hypothetical protein
MAAWSTPPSRTTSFRNSYGANRLQMKVVVRKKMLSARSIETQLDALPRRLDFGFLGSGIDAEVHCAFLILESVFIA